MSVKSYSITDIGRTRQMNQDYAFTCDVEIGSLPNLFMVADGMGGYKAGEFASKCTVETIVDEVSFSDESNPIKLLDGAIQKANSFIRKKSSSDENYKGMGTTLVCCSYDGETLIVANVGDSRLYLFGSNSRQITTDHSLVEEMIRMGELERTKARNHPDKNIITRAIGVVQNVDVDFFEVDDVRAGDIVLMCSDGLSNMVDDEEIKSIVEGKGTLEEKAEKLIDTANQNGGRDNIAVVLVELLPNEE